VEIDLSSEAPGGAVTAFAVADPVGALTDLDPRLVSLVESGELKGSSGATAVLHEDGGHLVAAGAGRRDELDTDSIRDAAAAVARLRLGPNVAWRLDESLPVDLAQQARAVVDGLLLGGYDQGKWKTKTDAPRQVERLTLLNGTEETLLAARRAERVAEWTNRARDLANRPPNDLTPERLGERAEELAAGFDTLAVEVFDLDQIRAMGMGSFAGVAQGSHNPARLIVVRYDPPDAKGEVVLGLVGKAVTFDTGGVSLKKAEYMEDMKGDMSGGAAVIEAMGAIADLGIPLRVLAVVGATENAIGGGAYRPGDILTARNGKTIEITNTDAEGRLVLADALWYAREQGATHLVDFATLTGAMERCSETTKAGATRSSLPVRQAATTRGRCRSTGAFAATTTPSSPI
jgi:leucyl aminopeptidase